MENKSVNTTIESSEIETAGQKAARSIADKILTGVVILCTLFFAISLITLFATIREEKNLYGPRPADEILSVMDSFRTGRIVFDIAETKAYGQAEQGDYVLPYSIAEYEEASLREYAYRSAGDNDKAQKYSQIKSDARDKMEYTFYADRIDNRYKYLENNGRKESVELIDGSYYIELEFEGGSGKAKVDSPTEIEINDGKCTALIRWSSPNYDYMIVDGEKYLPINADGNSEFLIPVEALDTPITVIGDTVAMSKPHEIEYTLTFHSQSLVEK